MHSGPVATRAYAALPHLTELTLLHFEDVKVQATSLPATLLADCAPPLQHLTLWSPDFERLGVSRRTLLDSFMAALPTLTSLHATQYFWLVEAPARQPQLESLTISGLATPVEEVHALARLGALELPCCRRPLNSVLEGLEGAYRVPNILRRWCMPWIVRSSRDVTSDWLR